MSSVVAISSEAGTWEHLWLRSLAYELGVEPQTTLTTSRVVTPSGSGDVTIEQSRVRIGGDIQWQGSWDVHHELASAGAGRRQVVTLMASDLDERLEHLLLEMKRAAAITGDRYVVVALGAVAGRGAAVDHGVEAPDADALWRTISMAAVAFVSADSCGTLGRLAKRAGTRTLGIGRGTEADHVLEVYSPMRAIDFIQSPPTAALTTPFEPALVEQLRRSLPA